MIDDKGFLHMRNVSDEIFTLPEAAQWLKVTPGTIRSMIKRKEIKNVMVRHKMIRIPKTSMEALFNKGE